jgi:hypothetical protein
MDTRFEGTWNFRSLCTSGSLNTVASEMAKCNLDLMAVQEVRWVMGDSQPADVHAFFSMEIRMLIIA